MLSYYLRLALLSLNRNRVLTALMVLAIGLGIGASMTSLTVFYLMAGNPSGPKNDVLHIPQLDNWSPTQPYEEPNEPPTLATYRDAMALVEAKQAKYQVAMFTNFFPVEPENRDVKPYMVTARLTTKDFFPMFEPPFEFGSGWNADQETQNARTVVLSRATNEKLFGGANSVGKRLQIGGAEFTVTGVLAEWRPTPKYYDITAGAFNTPEDVYLPIRFGIERELQSSQNNSCWKDEGGTGYQSLLDSDCIWLNVWVELASASDRERYLSFMDNYVTEQKKLGRFPRALNNRLSNVGEWLTARRVVRSDTRIQTLLAFGFLAVCLINTVGLLLAKFLGRAQEIGLRRALGASKRAIFAQFLSEAGMVGVAGGLLGLLFAWLGLIGVRRIYEGFDLLARLDWTMAFTTILLAVGSALIAGLLPTWRACQVAPALQLKSN